jgi:hypothetical protein
MSFLVPVYNVCDAFSPGCCAQVVVFRAVVSRLLCYREVLLGLILLGEREDFWIKFSWEPRCFRSNFCII